MSARLEAGTISHYDQKMYDSLQGEFAGHSDFHNFGYWSPGTQSSQQAGENLVEQLLALIPRREGRILDVGCGKGATTQYLTRFYSPAEIVGINISDKQLESCRRNAPGCTFLKMDAADLSLPDASFDAVLSVEAALHFRTRERFFRQACRVLRPGGHLVLSDILLTAEAERLNPKLVRDNHLEGPGEYLALLQRAGFGEITIRDVTEQTWGAHSLRLAHFLGEKLQTGEVKLAQFNHMMRTHYRHKLPAVRYYLLVGARKV